MLENKVIEIIKQIAKTNEVHSANHLTDDLELDSVRLIELAVTLEMEFDLPPTSEEQLTTIVTVADVVNFVKKHEKG